MLEEFASWNKRASLEPSGDAMRARWQAIEKRIATAKWSDVTALLRGHFHLKGGDIIRPTIYSELNKLDNTFATTDNEAEAGVATAGLIAETITHSHEYGLTTALLVLSIEPDTATAVPFSNSLHSIASKRIVGAARASRDPLENEIELMELPESFADAEETLPYFQAINDSFARISDLLRLREEETNLLWWFLNKSRQQDGTNSGCSKGFALAAGAAHNIRRAPGPSSIADMISSVLQCKDVITLGDFVEGVPNEELQAAIAQCSSTMLDLTPILLAAARSIEVPDAKSWIPAYNHSSGFNANKQHGLESLTLRTFYEMLAHQNAPKD